MHTDYSYPTQIAHVLLASQRKGAVANCLVPPSRHGCVLIYVFGVSRELSFG